MAKDDLFVGLEIGTSKICVVVGQADEDAPMKILGVGQTPSRGVRKGEIVDFETANKCIREALVDAEEKSDVTIKSITLGISGSHIQSFNNRGALILPEDRDEIDEGDYEAVASSARDVSLPPEDVFLHTILQHYYVDGQDGILNPVGMLGRKLEADFHIIYGVGNRVKNAVRCVKELGVSVEDVVFNGLASAQAVLNKQQKDLGALVLDIGGGTTDYIVYIEGAVKQSGVLGVGGDHVTNDISAGLRIPMAKAERIKVEEGSALIDGPGMSDIIDLRDDRGFTGQKVERETLNTIIRLRMRELLELVKHRLDEGGYMPHLGAGVFLTGGCSQMRGLESLVEEVFGGPVHTARAQETTGRMSVSDNPQYSTAIGLLRFIQATHFARPARKGFIRKIRGMFKWR